MRVPLVAMATSLVLGSLPFVACSSTTVGPRVVDTNDAAPSPVDAGPPRGVVTTDTALDRAHIGSDSAKPDFQKAKGTVDLSGTFEKVVLVVDLESPCFPFDKWKDDPPPAGHNWPASCDAFDRNFETSLSDPKNPSAPGLELVRAITPFGGPLHIEEDVTDIWNGLEGPRELAIHITTYSDAAGKVSGANGGWFVSAKIQKTSGPAPREVLAVTPLFYGSVKAEQSTRSLPFDVPQGATATRVAYRVTGHGGQIEEGAECRQPADEFCQRVHEVGFDEEARQKVTPWRKDCRSLCTVQHYKGNGLDLDYCAENPCGAQASVRASRANWCPGSVTAPLEYTPQNGAPGRHTFHFGIAGIAKEGSWAVSATAISVKE